MKRISMSFRRLGGLFAFVAGCLLFAAGCSDPEDGKKKTVSADLEGTDIPKKIIVATDSSLPPYAYRMKDGEITGSDVEIVQHIAKELGIEAEFRDMKFSNIFRALQNGDADIGVCAISITKERKLEMKFSEPLGSTFHRVVVPKDSDIYSIEKLKGKIIGVKRGSTSYTYVKEHYQVPRSYDNGELAIMALVAEQLDAVVLDGQPAKVLSAPYPQLKVLDEPLNEEPYGLAYSKMRKDGLRVRVDEVIEKMRKDGTLDRIRKKHEDIWLKRK